MTIREHFAVSTATPARRMTYCNPVFDGYFADPYVLPWDDGYLAYGTGSTVNGLIFEVLRSHDLASWTRIGGAMEPVAAELGTDCWAPEVVEEDGRFWLYYSIGSGDRRHHLRVATADSPLGPFRDVGVNLTPDELFAIDPHPFRDVDGRWYLYYARDVLTGERVGTHLAVAELATMSELAGLGRSVLTPTADWQIFERGRSMYKGTYDWHTLEGPNVRRQGDRYYCIYSGGSYLGEGYHVAWASAPHPLGPWSEPPAERSRLLGTVPGRVRGPGHNMVVTTHGGTDMLIYHAWNADGSRRQMCIDPLEWNSDGPQTPGPTWTEQPLPE
jgi:arabinan endo-1,5-alpha-L-arabinosidase